MEYILAISGLSIIVVIYWIITFFFGKDNNIDSDSDSDYLNGIELVLSSESLSKINRKKKD